MARITVDDCLEEVDNRFLLVHAAAQRTKELMAGSRPRVAPRGEKPVVVSLREIAAHKVHLNLVDPVDEEVEEEDEG